MAVDETPIIQLPGDDAPEPPADRGTPIAREPTQPIRSEERFPLDVQASVRCRDWKMAEKVATANVSKGGMFIRSTQAVEVGKPVEVTLQLPDGDELVLHGTVRHSFGPEEAAARGRPAGMGVAIGEVHQPKLQALIEISRLRQGKSPLSSDPTIKAIQQSVAPTVQPVSPTTAPQSTPTPTDVPDPPPSAPSNALSEQPAPAGLPAPAPPPSPPSPPQPTSSVAARQPKKAAGAFSFPSGSNATILGFDLGSSYSGVSVAVGSQVSIIPDEHNRTLQPSIIAFPEGDWPTVGWDARRFPNRVIGGFKRLLGKRFSDPQVEGFSNLLPLPVVAGEDDEILVDTGGDTYYGVEQVCAATISQLREIAQERLKNPIMGAVFTLPMGLTSEAREAYKTVAEIAEVEVMAWLEEPIAAALAHALARPGTKDQEIVAVYDFGGVSFNFSILELQSTRARVLASDGNATLGGETFDDYLARAVAKTFVKNNNVSLSPKVPGWKRLLLAAERTKRRLTTDDTSTLEVLDIVQDPQPLDLSQKVTRAAFERVCANLLKLSTQLCDRAFKTAGLTHDRIDRLVVTGGTTRIPFVRDGVQDYFRRPITLPCAPDELTVVGAGVQAAEIACHAVSGILSSPP